MGPLPTQLVQIKYNGSWIEWRFQGTEWTHVSVSRISHLKSKVFTLKRQAWRHLNRKKMLEMPFCFFFAHALMLLISTAKTQTRICRMFIVIIEEAWTITQNETVALAPLYLYLQDFFSSQGILANLIIFTQWGNCFTPTENEERTNSTTWESRCRKETDVCRPGYLLACG